MHQNAHDGPAIERRGDLLITRDLSVSSSTLGIAGKCDVVEFRRDGNGITLQGEDGTWQPYPVEYKRGAPKENDCDRMQLCAQAMCLEEMLCCTIPEGALYYGETRHRTPVAFEEPLRNRVREALAEMHMLYARGHTPKVKPQKGCNACSLKELCLPKLMKNQTTETYIRERLADG